MCCSCYVQMSSRSFDGPKRASDSKSAASDGEDNYGDESFDVESPKRDRRAMELASAVQRPLRHDNENDEHRQDRPRRLSGSDGKFDDTDSKSAESLSADVSRSSSRQRGRSESPVSTSVSGRDSRDGPGQDSGAENQPPSRGQQDGLQANSGPAVDKQSYLRMPQTEVRSLSRSPLRRISLQSTEGLVDAATVASPSPLSVSALAGQLYAQYAAPRPDARVSPQDAAQLYPGWCDDTYVTGVLGMSERQLVRRLCIGRPDAIQDRVMRLYRAFQHVAAGGKLADFAPGNASVDNQGGVGSAGLNAGGGRKIASIGVDGAKTVLQCLGRSESGVRDSIALKRFAAMLGIVDEPQQPAASATVTAQTTSATSTTAQDSKSNEDSKLSSPTATGHGSTVSALSAALNQRHDEAATPSTATVLEFFEVFGYVAEEASGSSSSVRSICSTLRMYAPFHESLAAIQWVLDHVTLALEHDADSSYWRIIASADSYVSKLGKFQQAPELLRACGFDEVRLDNGVRTLFILDGAHDHAGNPAVAVLPDFVKSKLMMARSELEAELEVMEGTQLASRVFREVEAGQLTVDNTAQVAWLGKVLIAGRTLLRYATNVLTNPRDSRLWRVNVSNALFTEKIRNLSDPIAARMMSTIGFHRQGDAFVLSGTREFDPAFSVTPSFPGGAATDGGSTSATAPGHASAQQLQPTDGANLPFFKFPSLPEPVLSFLLRRRIDLEGALFRIEAKLQRLGAPPPPDTLMQAAQVNAQAAAASDAATGPGSASSAVTPAVTAAMPAPPSSPTRKPSAGRGSKALNPDEGQTDVLMLRSNAVPETSLVVPILMRAALMTDAGSASAPAGGKAAAKRPAGRGGSSSGASAAGAGVAATDPKFLIHMSQLRLLKQAFIRLDTRGTGVVSASDLRAAFAAEARPHQERTDEAISNWIATRDLNGDQAVSWPEFAASFAALFLAPSSGGAAVSPADAKGGKAPPTPKPTAKSAAGKGAADQDLAVVAAEAAAALATARQALDAELAVLMTTAVAQLQSVMRASLPPGTPVETTAPSLLALPWASPVLDVLSGLGLLFLFCDRYQVRGILKGFISHITAVVSEPRNAALWGFRVTMPHEVGTSGQSAVALSSSRLSQDLGNGGLSTIAADATRSTDNSIAWGVARLPGMQLLLRGFGFEAVHGTDTGASSLPSAAVAGAAGASASGAMANIGKRGGVPLEYRLGGTTSTAWSSLPDAYVSTISACAQVIARHATVFEATEAADPVAVLMGITAVVCGSNTLANMLRKLAIRPLQPAAGAAAAGKGAKAPARRPAGRGSAAAPAAPGASDPMTDSLLDPSTTSSWSTAVETLERYIANVVRSPSDMGYRRINTNNTAFQHRLSNIPVPLPLFGYAGPSTELLPPFWPGVKTLTAAGFRETPDGSLVLPPTASIVVLQVRQLELQAVLPMLKAAVALNKARHTAAKSIVPIPSLVGPPGVPPAPAAAGGSVVSVAGKKGVLSQLPSTLLSSMLDPRTATSRRYSESNVLRGGDRLAEMSLNTTHTSHVSGGIDSFLNSSMPLALGSADSLASGFRPSATTGSAGPGSRSNSVPPPLSSSSRRGSMQLSVSFAADAVVDYPQPAPASLSPAGATRVGARSPSVPTTPSRPGSAGSTKGGKSKGGSGPSTPAPPPPEKQNADALVALGPAQAGDAVARILQSTEQSRVEANSKISELEKEVAELRAQVRTYQVADLVPKIKQSLGTLGDQPAVRTSAVGAAAGLGMRVAEPPAKVGAGSPTRAGASSPGRKASPSRAGSPGKAAAAGGKKALSASEKARLTSNPVVINSAILAAASTTPGEDTFYVQVKPSNMEGPISREIADRLDRGELFVPPQLQLKGGDWIMVGSDVKADLAFVCKVIPGEECERPGDQYHVILDRPLLQQHAEGDFITVQKANENDRQQFYKNEMIKFAKFDLLPEIIANAATQAEAAIRMRAAEGRFMHRTVKRRVPCAVQVYGDVSEALVPMNPKKLLKSPLEPTAQLVSACGPNVMVFNSHPPPGSMPSSLGLPPLLSLATPIQLSATPELFAHIFDLLDFGASGSLPLPALIARMKRDPTAWAAVCTDAVVPTQPLDGTASNAIQPTAHQVWQRLAAAAARIAMAARNEGDGGSSSVSLSRHMFASLFRPLHTLDFMSADKAGIRVLTYAHSGGMSGVLEEHAVEYWGRQWDTARAAAQLLSEPELDDIVTAFAHVHAQELLYPAASWTAMTSNSISLMDPRYPPPTELLTIRGVLTVLYALDGDAPAEAEVFSYACIAHDERVKAAKRLRRKLRGEIDDDDAGADVDDDDDDDEDEDTLVDAEGRHVPREPWHGLSFSDVVQFKVLRDKALANSRPSSFTSAKGSDGVSQPKFLLAVERRRLFPTPGFARLPGMLHRLQSAYRDVRAVLYSSIVDSLHVDSESVEGQTAMQEVDERVTSVPASDMIALLQRTDDGRRLLSFPLTLAASSAIGVGPGSRFVTIHSVLEHLSKACTSGHLTWAQLSAAISTCASAAPSILEAAPQTVAPAPAVPLVSAPGRPPAQHSLVPISGHSSGASDAVTVIDVATNLKTSSVCVLTSDGTLTAYDSFTLARRWVARAMPTRAAKALQWLRRMRAPYLKVLATPSAGTAEPVEDTTNLQSVSTEMQSQVVVNTSVAAYAIRLASAVDTFHSALFTDPADPGASSLLEIAWHSDAAACGHAIAKVTPRVVADTQLVSFQHDASDPNAGPQQVLTPIAGGTPLAMIEYTYIQEAHLIVGTAVPAGINGNDAGYKYVLESEDAHQSSNGGAASAWPRIMAIDALTGGCIADLGPVSTATTTGSHIIYAPHSRHIIAADVLPLVDDAGRARHQAAPVIKIWDLSPVIAIAARQRAVFLQAAVSADRAAAASTSLLNLTGINNNSMSGGGMMDMTMGGGNEGGMNETMRTMTGGYTSSIPLDDLIPQVLALPHIAVLDVMSQFPSLHGARDASDVQHAFKSGPAVADLCLLPHSRMLAVAQSDGRLSVWDANHKRHRIHYPPTCNFNEDDYGCAIGGAGSVNHDDDDPRFTRIPHGCHLTTSLKASTFYKQGGVLQSSTTPFQAAPDGRLLRDLPFADSTDIVLRSDAGSNFAGSLRNVRQASSLASAATVHVGLAAVSGGMPGPLRTGRLPCRIEVDIAGAARAADLAAGYASAMETEPPGTRKKDPDAIADAILDSDRPGSDTAHRPGTAGAAGDHSAGDAAGSSTSQGVFAGYVYLLDDGTCISVEAPHTSPPNARPIPSYLAGDMSALFDQRLVQLSDDVYFCAAASSDMTNDGYSSLKRVLVNRHRVVRAFFIVSKGVPLQSFMPSLTRNTIVAAHGVRATSSTRPDVLNVPVAAAPFTTIIQAIAITHDAAMGAAGVAVTQAPAITSLCKPLEPGMTEPSLPASTPPFICMPFYASGDTSTSVAMLRQSGPHPSPAFNSAEGSTGGRYWTTGHVVAVGSGNASGRLEVALEWEDRLVSVLAAETEVIDTASSVSLHSAAPNKRAALPGDRVLLCVRPATIEAAIGAEPAQPLLTPAEAEHVWFPPISILDEQPQPGMDMLVVHADTIYDASIGGDAGAAVGGGGAVSPRSVPHARVRRQVLMWAVGRAEADVPVAQYDAPLSPPITRAMDGGFLRHACATLLRQQSQWAGAQAGAIRRAAVRTRIVVDRALALYDAANSGGGMMPTAAALFRASVAVSTSEVDTIVANLRSALGYVWGLVSVQNEVAGKAASGGDVSAQRFLTCLVAAAWHYPWFRHVLRQLMSLGSGAAAPPPNGEDAESGSAQARMQVFAVASACTSTFKRYLLTEAGAGHSGSSAEEASTGLAFQNTLDACATTLRENVSLDSLLSVLEFLRDSGSNFSGGGVSGDQGVGEHMVDSLVRRKALPWDPPQLLAMGLVDGDTLQALTTASVVATPMDAYLPAEVAFLLADAPSVGVITEGALLALSKAFADPVAAMRTTLQNMVFRSDTVHERALLPEDTTLEIAESGSASPARALEGFGADIHALVAAEADAASAQLGTPLTLMSAHARLISLAASILGDGIIPRYAASMKAAMGVMQSKKAAKRAAKLLGRRLSQAQQDEATSKAATMSLMARIHEILNHAATSVSPEGIETGWLARLKSACSDFATLAITAASIQPVPNAPHPAVAIAAAQQRAHTQLVRLLSHGALESLVQSAVMHTCYAIKIPTINKKTAGQAVAYVASSIARVLSLLDDDTTDASRRLSPHVPRLMRSLVYLSTGRLDGIPDDIPADTSVAPPVLHPIDTKMLQPTYINVAIAYTQPLLMQLLGVDGTGALAYPAIRRYVSASGNNGSLARGPAAATDPSASGGSDGSAGGLNAPEGSPLVPLSYTPFVSTYSPYLAGLQRAAASDDVVSKTTGDSAVRQVISWSFEESVEQFAKRYMPVRKSASGSTPAGDFDDDDATPADAAGQTAAGILAMAATGTPHMISSYSTFRRCSSYWRHLVPCLVALDKLHQGMPDPILDAQGGDDRGKGDGSSGQSSSVAAHARIMDRIANRRHAIARFRTVMRPPAALAAGSSFLTGEYDAEDGTGKGSGGDGADPEAEDIDRSLLVTDLQLHDFTSALMMDPDREVRTTAFRAIRAVAVAVAGPAMESEADVTAELQTNTSAAGSFAARARQRRWGDLLLRFSQSDCTVAAARRLLAYLTWCKGGPSIGVGVKAREAPENYEVVSHAVDLLAAQAAARTAIPAAWRMCGVLGILVRLAKLGLPKVQPKEQGKTLLAKKAAGASGGPPLPPGSNATTKKGAAGVQPPKLSGGVGAGSTSVSDLLLQRLVLDHGNESMLTLAKFDAATRQWATEQGIELLTDTSGTWSSVTESLQNSLRFLRSKGILEHLAAGGTVADPGSRQSFLEPQHAAVCASTLGKLAAQVGSIRRALVLEMEQTVKGHASASGPPLDEAVSLLWDLCEVAWAVCISTPPDSAHRNACQVFLQGQLSTIITAFRRSPVFGCLLLGCPVSGDPADVQWIGLAFLTRVMSYQVHVKIYDPDAARFIQARAAFLLGDALSRALDLLALPFAINTADKLGTQRAAVDRRYSLTMLAQAADADIVPGFTSYISAHAKLISQVTAAGSAVAGNVHMFASQGQPFALGARGRALLWSVMLRCALMEVPKRGTPGLPEDLCISISKSYAENLCTSNVFRTIMNELLPSSHLLDTAHSSVPPALAPYSMTYPIRTEGAAMIYTAGVMFLRSHSVDAAAKAAIAGGAATAAVATGDGDGNTPRGPDGTPTADGNAGDTTMSSTIFQATIRGAAARAALVTPTASLPVLQAHLARVVASDGVLALERKRIWANRDLAYAPTVPMVLQGLLMAIPSDENTRNALEQMLIPQEAVVWYRAARRYFMAHSIQQEDAAITATRARNRYARAETEGVAAWIRWRSGKLASAPSAREAENARALAKGAAVPPPVPFASAATVHMSGRFASSGVLPGQGGSMRLASSTARGRDAGAVTAQGIAMTSQLSGSNINNNVGTAMMSPAMGTPRTPGQREPAGRHEEQLDEEDNAPRSPTKRLAASPPRSPRRQPSASSSAAATTSATGHGIGTVSRPAAPSASALKRPGSTSSLLPGPQKTPLSGGGISTASSTAAATAGGGGGSDILSSAARRMKKSVTISDHAGAAGPPQPHATSGGKHQLQPASKRAAVAATADVLSRLGEAVVVVKSSFDALARPMGAKGEFAIPATDRVLGTLLRSMGLPCPDDMIERLASEGYVASGPGACCTFSQLLRVIGRLMDLYSMDSLPASTDDDAAAAAGDAATQSSSSFGSGNARTPHMLGSAASTARSLLNTPPNLHDVAGIESSSSSAAGATSAGNGGRALGATGQLHHPGLAEAGTGQVDIGAGGPLFKADLARRLTLPPIPVPTELLRSIFERFASVKMMEENANPGSPGRVGFPSPGRRFIARGIPFTAWTAALAAAGVPVAPSEAREIFRFLELPLGEIVDMPNLRKAYLAIAGFRFLVMAGLMRPGSDMYQVVMSGDNIAPSHGAAGTAVDESMAGILTSGEGLGEQDYRDDISDVSESLEDRDAAAGGDEAVASATPRPGLKTTDLQDDAGKVDQ